MGLDSLRSLVDARGVAIALLIVLLFGLRAALLAWLKQRNVDPVVRLRVRRVSAYGLWGVALLLALSVWMPELRSLATFAGLVSAGVAIALKDVVANAAGWLFIVWRRPFELGDRIEIDGVRGDVVDIRIFHHSLMEIGGWVEGDDRTGRVLHVPNARVLTAIIANYTKGWFPQIWDEIDVLLTFESNWTEARRILQGIIDAAPAPPASAPSQPGGTSLLVMEASRLPAVFMSVDDSGIRLTLRYTCDPRQRRATRQRIWEAVLTAFAKRDDIDFAYPTQRFFDNAAEGKPALRPKRDPRN